MNIIDVFNELIEDKNEFDIFLDTLQEILEEDVEKGIPAYER